MIIAHTRYRFNVTSFNLVFIIIFSHIDLDITKRICYNELSERMVSLWKTHSHLTPLTPCPVPGDVPRSMAARPSTDCAPGRPSPTELVRRWPSWARFCCW